MGAWLASDKYKAAAVASLCVRCYDFSIGKHLDRSLSRPVSFLRFSLLSLNFIVWPRCRSRQLKLLRCVGSLQFSKAIIKILHNRADVLYVISSMVNYGYNFHSWLVSREFLRLWYILSLLNWIPFFFAVTSFKGKMIKIGNKTKNQRCGQIHFNTLTDHNCDRFSRWSDDSANEPAIRNFFSAQVTNHSLDIWRNPSFYHKLKVKGWVVFHCHMNWKWRGIHAIYYY